MQYKPVILLGAGARCRPDLIEYLCGLQVPVITSWMGADLLPEDSPAYIGRSGIFGMRAANIAIQKATHFYSVGARLDGEQVAYAYDRMCPNAKEIMILDVDQAELDKIPDFPSNVLVTKVKVNLGNVKTLTIAPADGEWLAWCKALYNRFRFELDGEDAGKFVHPFTFTRLLHEHSKSDDVFAIGSSGNAPTSFFQSYKVKQGQRISNVSTIGAMGADIPMALGAAMATGRRVICVTGDGGFQLNAQELETIRRLHLPIIFFVMNNGGYNSIRVGQLARFGRVTGANVATGFTMPRLEDLAHTHGFMYYKLDGSNLDKFDRCFVAAPLIVEVMVNPDWQELPRVLASGVGSALRTDDFQDMSPKLPANELKRIMEA